MNHPNPAKSTTSRLVECEVCLKEIPESAVFTPEGAEYVGHFCGIECYQVFLRQRREDAAGSE